MRQSTSALAGTFSSLGEATSLAVKCHISTPPLHRKEITSKVPRENSIENFVVSWWPANSVADFDNLTDSHFDSVGLHAIGVSLLGALPVVILPRYCRRLRIRGVDRHVGVMPDYLCSAQPSAGTKADADDT